MEVVAQGNLVWFPDDASLGSGFRSKGHFGGEGDAALRLPNPGSAFSFRNRCSMLQGQGKGLAGGLVPKVVSSVPASALRGSSNTVISTQFPVGWGHSLSVQSNRITCFSVPNSADFSSVTGEGSAPFLGSASPLFVPANTNAVAGTPVNAAAGGLLDVTSDVEQAGETIDNLLRVGRPSLLPASGSLPFNLDSALQESQESAGQLDRDLQEILSRISTLQIQNEVMSRQMKEYQELLMETAVSLNYKAQEARIEAVKLKKLAIMQKVEEMRKTEEFRKNVRQILKQEEVQRLENIAAARWQTIPDAPAGEEDASCEVDDGSGGSEEIAYIMNYLKESRSPEAGWNNELEVSNVEESEQARGDDVEKEREEVSAEMDVSSMTSLAESMECIITHPGALSCTKTVIRKDDERKTAVVSMETSVRCTGEACLLTGLDGDDYAALAIQTLAERAQELRHSRIQKSRLDADPVAQERHASIVNMLAHGRIVGSRPMEPPSRFGHESFVVQLQDEKTGEKMDALFKPRAHGDADGWHRAPVEWVAYELNLMLGMDLVPPVAYRRGRIELQCNKSFNEGALVYYVRNTKELRRVPATGWGVPVARLLSDTRILDCVLNNSDRHHGHFLFGEHWADRFKTRPALIDHAAGFRAEAVVNMTDENAFQTGPVRCVSAKTYLRLRFLEKEAVAQKFQGFLKQHEVEQMMKRRDKVLSYLDSLVTERGYQRTVIET